MLQNMSKKEISELTSVQMVYQRRECVRSTFAGVENCFGRFDLGGDFAVSPSEKIYFQQLA